jgi:recombinational DNA repair protein (RecF pathway)
MICTKCNQPDAEFYLAVPGKCKACCRKAAKAYYAANREMLIRKFRKRNASPEYQEQRKVYWAKVKAKKSQGVSK